MVGFYCFIGSVRTDNEDEEGKGQHAIIAPGPAHRTFQRSSRASSNLVRGRSEARGSLAEFSGMTGLISYLIRVIHCPSFEAIEAITLVATRQRLVDGKLSILDPQMPSSCAWKQSAQSVRLHKFKSLPPHTKRTHHPDAKVFFIRLRYLQLKHFPRFLQPPTNPTRSSNPVSGVEKNSRDFDSVRSGERT